MYNEIQKQKFIDSLSSESVQRYMRWMFTSLEEIEVRLQKDIALFELEDLQKVLNSISGVRRKNTESMVYNLERYMKWCDEQGIPRSLAIESAEVDTTSKIRSRMVDSPKSLARSLKEVFDDPRMRTIDSVYRTYLWLAYAGFTTEEAAKITESNIDFNKMKITVKGRYDGVQPIYEEAFYDFYYACGLEFFIEIKYSSANNEMQEHSRERAQGKSILRGKATKKSLSEYLETTVAQMIARRFQEANRAHQDDVPPCNLSLELSYDRVWLSGVFYRMYQKEKKHEKIDFFPVAAKIFDEHEARGRYRSPALPRASKISKIQKEYMKDYQAWKKAFFLD